MITYLNRSTDPCYNLAFEEYLFRTAGEDVFLVWRNEPCVVAGSGQNLCREVRPGRLWRLGIPMLRRISGGGTVYHDLGNINYSVITAQTGPTDYERSLAPILAALHRIGVPAERRGVCDLAIGGRKISGNAQYRLGDALVHHGSLLFATDLAQMERATTVDRYKIESKSIKSVRDRVTNIADHLPAPMEPEEFKRRMVRRICGPDVSVYTVTAEDRERICALAEEKFRAWDRIYGAAPKFNIERTGRFAGGRMQFKLDVAKGTIRSAAVYGDFFSAVDAETICAALAGCRYERSAVLAALRTHGIDGAVYRVTAEEMAAAIAD